MQGDDPSASRDPPHSSKAEGRKSKEPKDQPQPLQPLDLLAHIDSDLDTILPPPLYDSPLQSSTPHPPQNPSSTAASSHRSDPSFLGSLDPTQSSPPSPGDRTLVPVLDLAQGSEGTSGEVSQRGAWSDTTQVRIKKLTPRSQRNWRRAQREVRAAFTEDFWEDSLSEEIYKLALESLFEVEQDQNQTDNMPTDAEKDNLILFLKNKYPYDDDDSEDEKLNANTDRDHALMVLNLRKSKKSTHKLTAMFGKALSGAMDKSSSVKPVFTGSKDEKASAHLLLVQDWMKRQEINEEEIVKRFQETLQGNARIWYDELNVANTTWEQLQKEFTIEFSKQGKSIIDLKTEWVHYKFDPDKMDIRKFIREVKTTATLLDYDDDHIVTALKQAMPKGVYYAIAREKKLPDLEETLKEIFKHAQRGQTTSEQASGGNPFMTMMNKQRYMPTQLYNPAYGTLISNGRINPVLDTQAYWDIANPISRDGNQQPPLPPFKPTIQNRVKPPIRGNNPFQRGRGRGNQNRGGNPQGKPKWDMRRRDGDNWGKGNWQNKTTGWNRRGGNRPFRGSGSNPPKYNPNKTRRFQNPNPNRGRKPRFTDNDRQKAQDWNRCFYCGEQDHWQKDCPQKQMDMMKKGKPKAKDKANMMREIKDQYFQFLQDQMGQDPAQPYKYEDEEYEELDPHIPAAAYLDAQEN